jgi:putative endonuclease
VLAAVRKNMHERQYFVYILTNKDHRVLYTGFTGNLPKRIWEHKEKAVPGFTSNYNVNRLVYYEETNDVRSALEREKQIKGWRRAKKIVLIKAMNPSWRDLSNDF